VSAQSQLLLLLWVAEVVALLLLLIQMVQHVWQMTAAAACRYTQLYATFWLYYRWSVP
jgi:hypothetical protein